MFIVDEDELYDDSGVEQLVCRIDKFVKLLMHMYDRGEQVSCCNKIYEAKLAPDISLMDALFCGKVVGLDPTIAQALLAGIERCVRWNDVAISGYDNSGWSAKRYLHFEARKGNRIAGVAMVDVENIICVCDQGERSDIYYFNDTAGYHGYYKWLLMLGCQDKCVFIELSCKAFPGLVFADGIENQISNFQDNYLIVNSPLVLHLAALDKHFLKIFRENLKDTKKQMSEFNSCASVDFSYESTNTKNNKAAWKARVVQYNGASLRCELHTKLQPHYDRIHFYVGDEAGLEGKVFVGIFTKHLPT